MPEYVRVKEKGGAHVTVIRGEYDANPDAYSLLLKQPAVNENGDPLPAELPESTDTKKGA